MPYADSFPVHKAFDVSGCMQRCEFWDCRVLTMISVTDGAPSQSELAPNLVVATKGRVSSE